MMFHLAFLYLPPPPNRPEICEGILSENGVGQTLPESLRTSPPNLGGAGRYRRYTPGKRSFRRYRLYK